MPAYLGARLSKFSVASGFLFKITSSTASLSSSGNSSYIASWPAFTIPIFKPFLIEWNKNTECIASLSVSFPLKLKETLEIPPDIEEHGQQLLISLHASMNDFPYSLCSVMPVATAKTFGSKIIS